MRQEKSDNERQQKNHLTEIEDLKLQQTKLETMKQEVEMEKRAQKETIETLQRNIEEQNVNEKEMTQSMIEKEAELKLQLKTQVKFNVLEIED